MNDCIFCKIIAEKREPENTIFEDKKILVILDVDEVIKGHTLVIWKKHFENASELPLEDFLYFSKIFHKTEKALLETLGLNKSVVLKSGGLVSHFHFHIYPLKKNTSWQTVKDIFDKKLRYDFKPGEKEKLMVKLKNYF